jgi:ATP dependent DNA ligase domain
MRKTAFLHCIPSRGIKVPSGPDWIHEIKHDGYRLIVHREGKRVRLFTRNGYDWSDRYPLIIEAALRNRNSSFVIEAVLLGVDGQLLRRIPLRPAQAGALLAFNDSHAVLNSDLAAVFFGPHGEVCFIELKAGCGR